MTAAAFLSSVPLSSALKVPSQVRSCRYSQPPKATLSVPTSLAPRTDFPILSQPVNDSPLIYLDSAATSQKPIAVLQALQNYYETYNSNVHRGAHYLATQATTALERTRDLLHTFLNTPSRDEIIFTRNATEGINLVAQCWSKQYLNKNDVIVVSEMEHHANLVPWQMIASEYGAKLVAVPLSQSQQYDLDALKNLLVTHNVKLVAVAHVSNVLGCINPIQDICSLAHDAGAHVLVDACQSVPNMPVDISALGCDFLVASAHKMCGPTGVGFLWGRKQLLDSMPPFLGGGEMIADVFVDHFTSAQLPHKFEAGTPPIGEIVAFGAAVEYLNHLGMKNVCEFERDLASYLYQRLTEFEQLTVYGPPPPRAALCAFNVDGVHSSDLATMLDLEGVAVRSGHHCAQPLHRALGVNSSARASLYVYNTKEEIDRFVEALKGSVQVLGGKLTPRLL